MSGRVPSFPIQGFRVKFLRQVALPVFFCKCLLVSTAFAATPAERVQAFVEGTQTFKATFTQTIVSKAGKADGSGRKKQVSSGSVLLSRPGKFRWTVDKPYPQLMVGDGQKVWLYDPDLRQVTVRRMGETLTGTPAALLAGDNAIEKSFELSDGGTRDGIDWVLAVPRGKDTSFSRILLGFKGTVLQAMEMHDNFGQVTNIVFSGQERNPVIAASQFKFTAPAGADVVGE